MTDKAWTFENASSGVILGTYAGATVADAWAALCDDAGYCEPEPMGSDIRATEADPCGDDCAFAIITDISPTRCTISHVAASLDDVIAHIEDYGDDALVARVPDFAEAGQRVYFCDVDVIADPLGEMAR